MSENNYALIASSIRRSDFVLGIRSKNQLKIQGRKEMLKLIVIDIAASLAHVDPNFDKKKFYESCGVEYS